MLYYCPSWKKLHIHTYKLSQKIEKAQIQYDLIVAIARGGITIAHILSDFLKLPITTFTISSYKDLKQHKNPEISLKIADRLDNKHILLVDDVSDTGKTFIRGVEYLKELGAKHISTASVYIKPWTKHLPHFYVKKVEDWIVFPYDVRETIEAVSSNMKKGGENPLTMIKELQKIKIPLNYINRYSR